MMKHKHLTVHVYTEERQRCDLLQGMAELVNTDEFSW